MKTLADSKSRLSAILTREERVALSMDMFLRVVAALQDSPVLQGWMVVSRDDAVLTVAAERGGCPLMEEGLGLNASLCQASGETLRLGGEALLVIPGDVPLLSPKDIDGIVSLAVEECSAVVAPSRRRDGTNALLLKPPDLIPFSFGNGSFEAHLALARGTGAALHTYFSEGVAFDVDTEDDWRELKARLSATW